MPQSKDMVGSWFSTGYYGHVRSQPRNDFINEYRQLAKPLPPKKFVDNAIRQDSRFPFSLHDNRNSFVNHAIHFEAGMGKRRCPEHCPTFDPDFTTWMPLRKELSRSLPHLSTYQGTFMNPSPTMTHTHPQILGPSQPLVTCGGPDPLKNTTYGYNYGAPGCSHKEMMRRGLEQALDLSTAHRAKTARRNPPRQPESVATCLNWHRTPPSATNNSNNNFRRRLKAPAPIDAARLVCHVPAPPDSECPPSPNPKQVLGASVSSASSPPAVVSAAASCQSVPPWRSPPLLDPQTAPSSQPVGSQTAGNSRVVEVGGGCNDEISRGLRALIAG